MSDLETVTTSSESNETEDVTSLSQPTVLEFEPIREVGKKQLAEEMEQILSVGPELRNYGAFIVRHGGRIVANTARKMVKESAPPISTRKADGFEYKKFRFTSEGTPLHSHASRDRISIYRMFSGVVETVLLEGTDLPVNMAEDEDATDDLWQRGVFNGRVTRSLRATLYPHDVMVFDHSLPQAFRRLSEKRKSIVYFKDRISYYGWK